MQSIDEESHIVRVRDLPYGLLYTHQIVDGCCSYAQTEVAVVDLPHNRVEVPSAPLPSVYMEDGNRVMTVRNPGEDLIQTIVDHGINCNGEDFVGGMIIYETTDWSG